MVKRGMPRGEMKPVYIHRGAGALAGLCAEYLGSWLTGPGPGERPISHPGRQGLPAHRRALSAHRNLQGSSERKGDREVTFRQIRSLGTGKAYSVLQSASNVGIGRAPTGRDVDEGEPKLCAQLGQVLANAYVELRRGSISLGLWFGAEGCVPYEHPRDPRFRGK